MIHEENSGDQGGHRGRRGSSNPAWVSPYPNPYVTQLLSKLKKPEFTGRDSDWKEFRKDWEWYADRVKKLSGMTLDENIMLDVLTDSLDRGSKSKLEALRDENPSLTYSEFLEGPGQGIRPRPD